MRKRFTLPFLCILVAACTQQGSDTPALPPEEVLERAAQATQKLENAQYLITADYDVDSGNTWQAEGVLRLDGILQNAGQQVRFQTDITAQVEDIEQGSYSLDGTVELVVMQEDEVYMNIHSLTSQPNSSLFSPGMIGMIAGKWWFLPSQDRAPETASVTPDPRLLKAQAQVVKVVQDNGVTFFSGSDSYHYDVELDKQKLLQYLASAAKEQGETWNQAEAEEMLAQVEATGELWIDAETFFVEKLVWDISALPFGAKGAADVALTVTFRNHNAAPNIEPPTEAQRLTPAVFFGIPSDAMFEDELPGAGAGLTGDEDFESLLNTLQ